MAYMMKHAPLMEREIGSAEDVLSKLVERLGAMGLGDSIATWLDGDPTQSFFEFTVSQACAHRVNGRGGSEPNDPCEHRSLSLSFSLSFSLTQRTISSI